MSGVRDDLKQLKGRVGKFKGRQGYKLLPSPTDPSKKRWQKVEQETAAAAVPKRTKRAKKRLTAQQSQERLAAAAREAVQELREKYPEFVEEMWQAFAEAEEEGQGPRPTRLSYRPQKDREALDPDGYENLGFYGDFLTQEELAEIAQVLREQRMMRPIPQDPEQLEAEVRAIEERYRRKDR